MKLSTSTNLLFLRPEGNIYPPVQAVEKIAEAGFRFLDFNFYDWVKTKNSPYMQPYGDEWIIEMAEQAKTLKVSYEQAHSHFFNFMDPDIAPDVYQHQQRQVIRSLKNAEILGAKVAVMHPCTGFSREGSYYKVSKEGNINYFKRILEETADIDIKIALENMADIDTAPTRKYCVVPDELAELVECIQSERIGVCWDFEHGELMKQDQPEIIRSFGSRLLATHVSDAHGYNPVNLTHRLPMTGTTKWKPIVNALYEIGYAGCFSFEAHNFLNTLPDCAIEPALRLAYKIGEYLIEMRGEECDQTSGK